MGTFFATPCFFSLPNPLTTLTTQHSKTNNTHTPQHNAPHTLQHNASYTMQHNASHTPQHNAPRAAGPPPSVFLNLLLDGSKDVEHNNTHSAHIVTVKHSASAEAFAIGVLIRAGVTGTYGGVQPDREEQRGGQGGMWWVWWLSWDRVGGGAAGQGGRERVPEGNKSTIHG